ncbi:unnamed protein product [Urochloa humidicola]
MLHHGGSNKVVVLCHGFAACKDDSIMIDLASALTRQGISVFRFDFSGNGASEGEFQYGNYRKEADDLHSVVSYLYHEKYDVTAIVGHSKDSCSHNGRWRGRGCVARRRAWFSSASSSS